jgi:hypothetical protein
MNAETQISLTVLGIVLTALLTLLLGQITGLRKDMKEFLTAQKDMNDRLLVLETEHENAKCRYKG